MSNIAHIVEQLQGMHEDFVALEADMQETERQRLDFERSPDRIPEMVAEAKLLAAAYKMSYAVLRSTTGVYHIVAARSANKKDFIALII